MEKSEYHKYLASREWALLKEQVKERSENKCERCKLGSHDVTHHKTYERIGHEEISDLVGLCEDCHKFLSGKSDHDPNAYRCAIIAEGIARIRKSKGILDSAYDLMNECFPDGEHDYSYYNIAQHLSFLLKSLTEELDK